MRGGPHLGQRSRGWRPHPRAPEILGARTSGVELIHSRPSRPNNGLIACGMTVSLSVGGRTITVDAQADGSEGGAAPRGAQRIAADTIGKDKRPRPSRSGRPASSRSRNPKTLSSSSAGSACRLECSTSIPARNRLYRRSWRAPINLISKPALRPSA